MDWNYKYGRHTVQERWDQMWGTYDSTFDRIARLSVLAFAVFTAASPQASYYIAPHIWAIMYLLWYWYPM